MYIAMQSEWEVLLEELGDFAENVFKILSEEKISIVLLNGVLGAGKTTFAKELLHISGCKKDEVTSPSFDIIHEYMSNIFIAVYHMDFYRLKSASEILDLGFVDILNLPEKKLILIEWGDIAKNLLESFDFLEIDIKFIDGSNNTNMRKFSLSLNRPNVTDKNILISS